MLSSTSSAARVILWRRNSLITVSAFSWAASRLSWAWMALSMWVTSRTLAEGLWLNTLRQKCNKQRCYRALGRYSATLSTRPRQASEMISRTFERPRSTKWRRKADQPDLSSLAPSQMPRILPVALRVQRAGHQQRDVAHLALLGPLHDDPVQVQIGMLALEGANLKVRGGNPLPTTTFMGSLDVLGNRGGFI